MKLNRVAGAVVLVLAGTVLAFTLAQSPRERTGGYVVAAILGAIGLWRLFARKGH